MKPLHETARPQSWADVVGQDKAVRALTSLRDRGGFAGRAYWITGASGTGKTTIARLIAGEVAEPWIVEELDAQFLTPARVREYAAGLGMYGPGKGGRAVIVNEAHGLGADTIRALLVELERIPPHAVWAFTTTTEGQADLFGGKVDAPPLLSRCVEVRLSRQGLNKPFAARAMEVARAHGLDGLPLARYERLAKESNNNLRAMLSAIEGGAMVGE